DKSPELRDDCRRALAAIRGEIGDALVALEQRQELSATAKRELKAILAEPMLLRDWHLAGAWKKEHRPEFDPAQAPALEQKVLAAGHPRTWRQLSLAPERDRWNLLEHMKPVDGAWCVGYATIDAEREEASELQLGSDDQLTVWLNGVQVYEHRDSRGWGADQARVPVTLKAGPNHLWVLAGNDSGPWEFSVRLRREDPRFAFLNVDVADRPGPEAYREFALQKPGDPQRGRKLFEDRQGVGCIKCHAVAGQGATIGPDLLSVGTKYPREELIRSVLEPSNRILSGYQVTIVITDDGRTHQGIVKRETPEAIELVDAEGKTTSLAVDTVVEREDANVSMMPNGLKDGLTLDDFADIVGYLESLKQEAGAK
ncbi:MAG: c-type cytochrome, partial [Planctomycetaceae bacterium]|nr:c-type cytochrome [Planctomycetaceae bacterium]